MYDKKGIFNSLAKLKYCIKKLTTSRNTWYTRYIKIP